MSSRIHALSDGVVNQIAAGEVVERPASVLKEILENAVDSGAGRIDVQVSGGFPFLIRVADDGCGMTREELATAIRRHTTSKIGDASDLEKIATYGFRGEALPSIGSVARLRIVSRPAGQPDGGEILVDGGTVREVREVGAPPGTTVEIGNIFSNVPARLKFLKTPRTEMGHLWEVYHMVSIPREGVAFRMSDGRTECQYEARETRNARAQRHAGADAKYLVPLSRSSAFFRLSGWVGLPHLSRFGASGLTFFVNGRHFRDRGLLAAVREAYRGMIPADRQPVVYLFVECDPAEVDVNVHPSKTEVRFRYARDLFELVRHAIGETLGEPPQVPSGPPHAVQPSAPTGIPSQSFEQPFPARRGGAFFGPRPIPVPRPHAGPVPGAGDRPRPEDRPSPGVLPFPKREEERGPEGGFFLSLRPVGQLFGTYIVCEGPEGMVIVDQHAADERIVFSRLKESLLGRKGPVQRWLHPKEVTLPGAAVREREEVEEFLLRVGFTFERADADRYRITGGPAALGSYDVDRWWRDLTDFLVEQESAPKGIFDADRELWRLACHSAVRGGDALDAEAMRTLLRDLSRAVASHSCPHGRPVWVKLSRAELERMFLRA